MSSIARTRSPSATPKAPPAPTDLNLSALEDALAVSPDGIIRKVEASDAPHLRRCVAAGLLAPAAGAANAWCLSAAGTSALAARRARRPSGFTGYLPGFLDRELLAQILAHAVAAQTMSSTESVVLLHCWDRPSTIAEALTRLGLPTVLAEALEPGTFTAARAPEPFTLEVLLKARRDWPIMPADITGIAALAPGETHELRLGSSNTIIRRVGEPARVPCSAFARRMSNVLALHRKVLHGQ